jgi:putative selenium metabolism hydrolase
VGGRSREGALRLIASFESALAFAADLIRIPGLSGQEAAVAARVREEMEALGLADVRIDAAGSVIGVARGRGQAPPVMLACHLDVVAEGEHADWEVPPFSGEIRDGWLHGRGAMDIKGPLALQTHAAASLIDSAPGDIIVAHTVIEERGGLGMRHLLESGTVEPAAVILGEATHGDVCIGHRGRAELEIVLEGVAGHASAPDRARNALDLLPHALGAVQDLVGEAANDTVLGEETIVATMVDVTPATRNVVPDLVVVAVDWRVLPGSDEASLVAKLESRLARRIGAPREGLRYRVRYSRLQQRTYTGMEEEVSLHSPGYLLQPDHPVVLAAAKAAGRRDGAGQAHIRPWQFATDGGWTCGVHGIPTIGFAPGEERFAHTNRERLDLAEAAWAYERYPDVIRAVQECLSF